MSPALFLLSPSQLCFFLLPLTALFFIFLNFCGEPLASRVNLFLSFFYSFFSRGPHMGPKTWDPGLFIYIFCLLCFPFPLFSPFSCLFTSPPSDFASFSLFTCFSPQPSLWTFLFSIWILWWLFAYKFVPRNYLVPWCMV